MTTKTSSPRKYGKSAGVSVGRALHKMKAGTLKSGRSKLPVTTRAQAIAIGLSEARARGAKTPPAPPKARRRARRKP